jgi:hypothetical protein
MTSRRSVGLGVLGFLATVLLLNGIYTRGFIDLLPTAREFTLLLAFVPLLLPVTLLDECWLRTLQYHLSSSRLRWGIPVALSLLPKVIPLVVVSLVFGRLVLIAGAILFPPTLFTTWLFHDTHRVAGGAVYTALLFAWVLAVILPFG